jgi:hypothetical protein
MKGVFHLLHEEGRDHLASSIGKEGKGTKGNDVTCIACIIQKKREAMDT